jgi:hypothetical protein
MVVSAPSSESEKVVPTAIAAEPLPTEIMNCDPCPCGSPETEYFPESNWLLHPSPSQLCPSKTSVNVASLALPCLEDFP